MNYFVFMIFVNLLYASLSLHFENKFVTYLQPICQDNRVSSKVIQGFDFYKNYLIVSQTRKNKVLCINILNLKGESVKSFLFKMQSHPQDLSVCKNKIFTRGKKTGLFVFQIKKNNIIDLLKFIDIKLYKNTSVVDKNCQKLIAISKKKIYIFDIKNLKKISLLKKFPMKNDGLWIQGITFYKKYIFVLKGKNTIFDRKILDVYSLDGTLIKSYYLFTGFLNALLHGLKWELEGLAIKNKSLYTIVILQNNKKALYKILNIINY